MIESVFNFFRFMGDKRSLALLFVLLALAPASTRARTVGLFLNEPEAYDGYTLFAPMRAAATYLIDNQGRLVHSWESSLGNATAVYLLEDGRLLRTARYDGRTSFDAGGAGGVIELVQWDGLVDWRFEYSSDQYLAHHDVEYLPNGNVLLIAWEKIDWATALSAGRNPDQLSDGELWPDKIIEVDSAGKIVWQWRVWDHLVQHYDPAAPSYNIPADRPERIDFNFTARRAGADWTHINSIDYNSDLDQIILSVHEFSEIWIINHSLTTAEAAGPAGDLLYRWGNPQAYGAGSANDQQLFSQHDAQWIEAESPGDGDILVFNNGINRPAGDYSTVNQISPPLNEAGQYGLNPGSTCGPSAASWSYQADPPSDFYSLNISGAQRQPNGNTLVCEGATGTFFEVTESGRTVWMYVNPVTDSGSLGRDDPIPSSQAGQTNQVFKIRRYGLDYPGLIGRDLTPGEVIEQ